MACEVIVMRHRSFLLKCLSALLVFGSWEIAGRVPVSFAFPTFLESMLALWVLIIEGTLFVAYAETLKPLVLGVFISGVLGLELVCGLGLAENLTGLFHQFL